MPGIEWAVLCDLAYFDAARSLCVIGVQPLAVPTFSAGVRRFSIAARVPGLSPYPTVAISMSTPDDSSATGIDCQRVQVESVGDHLVVNVGVAPLIDDGIYRFELTLGSQPALSIDLPIAIVCPNGGADLPSRGMTHVGLS